ncbi:VOC family protein [Nereida sp. MMG025]|uniref:VOC family protein n=1 Tax=Nereida sp. MMG025 TaxID=2909981 RepID=UPI001F2807F0|nr:VOC family protein [Nereida sp. MMG025]MCF6443189.1 VOC family protein [Nereida sp. MMG025]
MTNPVPVQPVGVDHLVFWVDDLAKAKEFYCGVLGCLPGFEYPDIAMTHLWFGSVLIGLWDASDPRAAYAAQQRTRGTNMDHVGLAVGPFDPDEMRAHLLANNVHIEKELTQGGARGIGHSIYIHDPFGNRIELKGPPQY